MLLLSSSSSSCYYSTTINNNACNYFILHLQQTIQQIRKEIDSENRAYLDMTTQIQDLEFELRNVKAEAEEEKEKVSF